MIYSKINKISYKLILAVCGVTISIISIFSYFIIKSQHKGMIDQLKIRANQCSETIKSATEFDMLQDQREHIYSIIDGISGQEGLVKIRIFNKLGEITYSTNDSEIGHLVDKHAESCFACHAVDAPLEKLPIPDRSRIFTTGNGQKQLGIINPIYNGPGCWQADCHAHPKSQTVLGVLDITMVLDEVEQQINANRTKVIMLTLSAIITISLLLLILVHHLVGKPVSQLVKATRIVADGNLEYRIKKFKNDELGFLEQSFNEMTSKLATVQRQLYQSDKLASLGRLTSGIAHEINNPLTGVLSYSSILVKREDLPSEVKEDLEVIVRESKRCRDIVKRLLDFARQEPPKKTNVNINEVITRTTSLLSNQFNLKNISVQINSAGDMPSIKADANQLQQVFINLLVNAADATDTKGGKIHISTGRSTLNDVDCII
ncbi:MAG: histidine kinase dimerization/phospho-acceptor domain-containing protein, partial [candidate division KSB1 bacterium]|nr:histidine kinase dimerization/phospho-acceptor domain-containing protein [candidate division KSB1 bacterium]